jgi:hypothetical protein
MGQLVTSIPQILCNCSCQVSCLMFSFVTVLPVPAGVIRYFQMAAVVAVILMAAKDSGSAYLDGAHDPPIIAGQPMGFSIRRAVLTENIRHLKAAR